MTKKSGTKKKKKICFHKQKRVKKIKGLAILKFEKINFTAIKILFFFFGGGEMQILIKYQYLVSFLLVRKNYRSSRLEVFYKKVFLEIPQNSHLCESLFYNKVSGLRPATLLKRRFWHRCFSVNLMKPLRAPFIYRTPLVAVSKTTNTVLVACTIIITLSHYI